MTTTPRDDGGPAFPLHAVLDNDTGEVAIDPQRGMSLRDYFAAKAMQGDLANPEAAVLLNCSDETLRSAADLYYRLADAMLAARRAN